MTSVPANAESARRSTGAAASRPSVKISGQAVQQQIARERADPRGGAAATARETSSRLPPGLASCPANSAAAHASRYVSAREPHVERLELPRGLEQQQRRVAAAVCGERDLGLQQIQAGLPELVERPGLRRREQLTSAGRTRPPPGSPGRLPSALSARRAGSPDSATARCRNAAAAARPPRVCARTAERSSSRATCSSGPAAAAARCQARRSGSTSRSVSSASARWTARRSCAAADR